MTDLPFGPRSIVPSEHVGASAGQPVDGRSVNCREDRALARRFAVATSIGSRDADGVSAAEGLRSMRDFFVCAGMGFAASPAASSHLGHWLTQTAHCAPNALRDRPE